MDKDAMLSLCVIGAVATTIVVMTVCDWLIDWMKENKMKEQTNEVNHPEHYTSGDIECIDAIQSALTPEEFRGYIKGNVLKYIWRERNKGNDKDLKKARWYLNRLLISYQPKRQIEKNREWAEMMRKLEEEENNG